MKSHDTKRDWLQRPPNEKLYKNLKLATWILTAAVLILVGLMRRPELRIPLPEGVSLDFLPIVHAVINTLVSIALIGGLLAILKGKIHVHRSFMMTAMGLSVVFLLCYVAYHFTNTEVLFGDSNGDGDLTLAELQEVEIARPLYLVLLISHILAAGVSLPMILLTFSAAWTNKFPTHRALARWVFPIWLYVAVTGPICYLLLRPYY